MDDHKRALEAFTGALDQTLDFWLERLSAAEIAGVVEQRLVRLRASEAVAAAIPEVSVAWTRGTPEQVSWSFGGAAQLEAQLDNIFKLQAICLEMDPGPEVLRDVEVMVKGAGQAHGVKLVGRVVHRHKDQVAIQLDKPGAPLRAALDEMLHELRYGRATIPAPVPNREPAPTPAAAQPAASAPAAPVYSARPAQGTQSGPALRATMIAAPVTLQAKRFSMDDGVVSMMARIAALKPTGLLELKSPAFTLTLTLERGCIQDIMRTPLRDQDSLERLLLSAGKLNELQVKQARDHAEQYQITPGEALIDLALLEYGDVRVALKTRVLYMGRQLWSGHFNEASLTELERLPQRSLALPVFLWSMLYRHVLEDYSQRTGAELEALREPSRGMSIRRVDPMPCEVGQLDLAAKHQRLFSVLLEEPRTEAEIVSMAQLGRVEVLSLLLTLKALGLIEENVPDAALQRRTRQLDALVTAQARINTQDHFAALGLHWSAFDEEIEAAYKAARAQYDPDTGEFAYIAEAKATLREVVALIDRAYAELRYPGRRAAYRNQLIDSFKIRSSIEMFEKQIDMAKMRRDIDEAIVFCKRILELQPGNSKAVQDLKLLATAKERQTAALASAGVSKTHM
jgi:hypothetical protein